MEDLLARWIRFVEQIKWVTFKIKRRTTSLTSLPQIWQLVRLTIYQICYGATLAMHPVASSRAMVVYHFPPQNNWIFILMWKCHAVGIKKKKTKLAFKLISLAAAIIYNFSCIVTCSSSSLSVVSHSCSQFYTYHQFTQADKYEADWWQNPMKFWDGTDASRSLLQGGKLWS